MESNLSGGFPADRHGVEATPCAEVDVHLPERLEVRVRLREIEVGRPDEHTHIEHRRFHRERSRGAHGFRL